MSNKQKTAVEWLIERLLDLDCQFAKKLISLDVYSTTKVYLQEKAKEMEKGQIKDAFVNGFCNAHDTEDKSLNADTIFYRTRYGGNK